MSFDAGSITAAIELNTSSFSAGVGDTISSMIPLPGLFHELIEGPLQGLAGAGKEAFAGVVQAMTGDLPGAIASFASAAKEGISAIGEALEAVGKEAVNFVVESFTHVAEQAHQVGVEAEKVGVSASFLSSFGQAAQVAGGSVNSVADGIKFLGRNAAEAAQGNKELADGFARIGLIAADVQGGMTDLQGLFTKVASGINGLGSDAEKTRAEMELLGRGGIDLGGVFKNLDEVKEVQSTLGQLGANITEPMAAAGAKVGELGTIFSGFFTGLQNAVATPILQSFADNFDAIKADIIAASDALRPKLQAVGEAIGPYILPAIDIFKQLAVAIAGSIDMGFISSALGTAMSLFRDFADVLTGVVIPAFKLLEEILTPIFNLIGGVGDVIHSVLSGLGLSGITTSAVPQSSTTGYGASGGTNINIESLNVPPIDVNEASSAIAGKIQGPLQRGLRGQRELLDSAAFKASVAGGL